MIKCKCITCGLEQDLEFKPKTFQCMSCIFRPQVRLIRQYMQENGIVEFTIKAEAE